MIFSVDQVDADKRIIDFRHRWLRDGKPRETAIFDGDSSKETYHFAALSNRNILGIVSYFKKNNAHLNNDHKSYQLRSMAVDSMYRQQNIGKRILDDSFAFLQSKEIDLVWCNARQ